MSNQSPTTIAELLLQGSRVRFSAGGPSMHPTIRDGEIVEVRPVERNESLRIGQVILFRAYDRLLLHRVIRVRDDRIETAGDAAIRGGEMIRRQDLLGIAVSVARKNRYICLEGRTSEIAGLALYWLRPVRGLLHKILSKRNHTTTLNL